MPIEPNPFDDARLVEIRANQDDPIIQYYIIRTDVQMSVGKIGAQIAHGAQMFAFGYEREYKENLITSKPSDELTDKINLTYEWLNGSFTKVVLGGKKKDFEKIIEKLYVFLVRDAGLTEVEPGTETVIVTWPMRKSQQPKVLSRLQVLKGVLV